MPERRKWTEYLKMLKPYSDILTVEQMCEILGGISAKTGYKTLKEKSH